MTKDTKKEKAIQFKDLIGKTITSAVVKRLNGCDDEGFLQLRFSDGTKAVVVASYGGYTGRSEDEYPTYINIVEKMDKKLVKC